MANGSTADKAFKARVKAEEAKMYGGDSRSLANKIAKTATGKDLTYQEEQRAGKIIQNRRMLDTGKTATRASFIERRTAKKASSDRIKAAVGGGATPKKQAPKPAAKKPVSVGKPTTSKAATFRAAAGKPMAKPTAKAPAKTTPKAPAKPTKAPVKKKVVQMPSKISPSKMTPAQKAKYLQNPERYDG